MHLETEILVFLTFFDYFCTIKTDFLMLTLTRNIIKEVRALDTRKGRREQSAWLAEGRRMVGDLLEARAFRCLRLFATDDWWQEHPQFSGTSADVAAECYTVSQAELGRLSLLQAPQDVMAVFALPDAPASGMVTEASGLSILLDEVQDPGNLGTIIRTADWFGVRHIYCTPGTADCFAPKVVQATMSALARVRLHYFGSRDEACAWLSASPLPVYGTFLDGHDIYHTQLQPEGILVMGNEGRGVSAEVAACVSHRLLIPHFATDGQHVESLNVSVATAICLSEIRRR